MTLLLLLKTLLPSGGPLPVGQQLQSQLSPVAGYRRRLQSTTWVNGFGAAAPYVPPPSPQVTDLPTRAPQRAAQLYEPGVNFTVALPAPQTDPQTQTTADTELPPRAPARLRDYTWTSSSQPNYLDGEVAPMGVQATELPPRAAARARDYTWLQSFTLPIYGELPFGQQTTDNLPAKPPSRSRDYTFTHATDQQLIGQDAMAVGDQFTDLPPRAPARSRDYTWLAQGPPQYLAGEVAPVGVQSVELPPRAPQRLRDYSWLQSFALPVFGELPFGQQTTDNLPPRSPARSRDYTFLHLSDTQLIGQDAMTSGEQSYELPPAYYRPLRSRDYSFISFTSSALVPIFPAVQSSLEMPPKGYQRSRDYTWTWLAQTQLIGQDAMVTGVQAGMVLPPRGPQRAAQLYEPGFNFLLALLAIPVPTGAQATDLPPRAAARSRDYTWLASSPPNYLAGEVAPMGAQSVELPPRGRERRQPAYETPYNDTVWLDLAAQAVPQVLSSLEMPPRGALRSRDYTFIGPPVTNARLDQQDQALIQQFTQLPPVYSRSPRSKDYTFLHLSDTQLIGQDAMAVGEQVGIDLPPRGYQRASSLSDPGANFAIALTQVPGPAGVQFTDLPPKGYARSRDYTWLQTYSLVNFEQLPPGQATLREDLAPRATPRSRDYTWLHLTDQQLIGQDAMAPGKQTFAQDDPPRGPARSKDYTWLQTLPLHIYQQLPPGQSTIEDERPPRAPLRLKDYTFLHLSDTQLIGKDAMVVGDTTWITDNLPPRGYARLRDYTFIITGEALATGKPPAPGTVLSGTSITDTVLSGTSATGSLLGGTSLIGTVLPGPSQNEL